MTDDDYEDLDDLANEDSNAASIEEMIQDCEDQESKLSDWASSFVASISRQYETKGTLTPKQEEKLKEIWSKL